MEILLLKQGMEKMLSSILKAELAVLSAMNDFWKDSDSEKANFEQSAEMLRKRNKIAARSSYIRSKKRAQRYISSLTGYLLLHFFCKTYQRYRYSASSLDGRL